MSKTESTALREPAVSAETKLKIRTTQKYMADLLVMMAAPAVMAWYYYGMRAVMIMFMSVLTAVLCEAIGKKLYKVDSYVRDLSAVVCGMATALCLPASIPLWMPCLASAFAVMVVKLPFGNTRGMMFVPTAAGIAFLTICNSAVVFGYSIVPSNVERLSLYGTEGFILGDSLAKMLQNGNSIGTNLINYIDILVGNVPGPMGATCAVAMLGALLYFIIRHPRKSLTVIFYLLVCGIYAFIFPRVTTGRLISVVMELSSGLLLFSGIFFLTAPNIMPKRTPSRICFGATAGLLVMLFRSLSTYEDSTAFAVLLMCAVSTVFDEKLPLTRSEKIKLKKSKASESAEEVEKDEKKEDIVEKTNKKREAKAAEMAQSVKINVRQQIDAEEGNEDDDVPTLQEISEIKTDETEESETGGSDNG